MKNTKAIHAYEQLALINDEKDEIKKLDLLKQYGSRTPLNYILSLNFRDDVQLDLPEGMPPIDLSDLDEHTHPDFMGSLSGTIARLHHCKKGSDLSRNKKQAIFYEVLTSCPIKDAEVLCSAKDKSLTELYPNITADLVKTVFPNYVTKLEVKDE